MHLWNVRTGQTRQLLAGHGHEITRLGFDPDGQVVASVGGDRAVLEALGAVHA